MTPEDEEYYAEIGHQEAEAEIDRTLGMPQHLDICCGGCEACRAQCPGCSL